MSYKTIIISALVASTQARFGQEHPKAIDLIGAVTSGGQPGEAATIAGGAISNLLAAANPCTKLQTGDKIIAQLGTGADAVAAAQAFVQAEQNFNPFNQDTPTLCSDPSLPSSAQLRGIVPLIDPAVGGADLANQLSATSLTKPFDATGLSVADVFAAQGFSNFTTKDLAGTAGAAPATGAGIAVGDTTGADSSNTVVASTTAAAAGSTSVCSKKPASAAVTTTAAAASGNAGGNADADAGVTSCVPSTVTVTSILTINGNPGGAATTLATSAVAATPSAAASGGAATGGSAPTDGLLGVAAQTAAQDDTKIGTGAKTTLTGADFGTCVPTIFRAAGQNGRKDTEFTFNAVDPKILAVQQEALNPNIITNRICDELTNQCGANQTAKDACLAAKAQISALGVRDQSTADAWNTALGF